ncbi:MAG: hypothetical protein ABWZ25_11675 [Chitinophagaceae bacterium]
MPTRKKNTKKTPRVKPSSKKIKQDKPTASKTPVKRKTINNATGNASTIPEATVSKETTSRPFPDKSAAITDIKIRMYGHGFGDCFLLFFYAGSEVCYKMVIDCGMLTGDSERLRTVIQNIAEDCEGSVDVVVQTHEHKDHVSGFNLRDKEGRLLWDQIAVSEAWLAWTENTGKIGDELAKKLKHKHDKKLTALVKAVARYEKHITGTKHKVAMKDTYTGEIYQAAQNRYVGALKHILNFAGIEETGISEDFNLKNGEMGLTVKQAMNYFTDRNNRIKKNDILNSRNEPLTQTEISYWEPGEIADRACTGLNGVNIYFLGPPKDYERLKQMDDKTHSEMYVTDMGLSENFYYALDGDKDEPHLLSPFGKQYHCDETHQSPEEKENPDSVCRLYYDTEHYWREIDADWLNNTGALALALDSYTNNTSLVMAIEFTQSRKVLMFVGDAQIGNWISWTEPENEKSTEPKLKWKINDGEKTNIITARDLLQRTVFYKVGHHASHNATGKENGLELMISPELVAMIPVDEKVAGRQGKRGWKMPAEELYSRLLEKTKGKIIRIDLGNLLEKGSQDIPDGVRPPEKQRQEFNARVTKSKDLIESDDKKNRPLYWEYTVKDR